MLLNIEFASVEVHQFPGEPECFASAQAEDQDQDVARVQRVVGVTGMFEEPPCFLGCPPATLALTWRCQPDYRSRIARDGFFFDGAGKRGPQGIACIFPTPGRQCFMAAFTGSAATPLVLWPGRILALTAALADASQFVKSLPDVFYLDFVETLVSQMRSNVQSHEHVVLLVRLWREVRLNDVL